jgi:ADP-ribosylglycohydrolase
MRAAPCGLFDKFPLEYCYDFGRDGAKLTHHHPEGFVSAGVLAVLIGAIREGATVRDAAERALGVQAIPYDWLSALELRDAITQLANDMVTRFREGREWMKAYPPN